MNLGTDIGEILVSFEDGILTLGMHRPEKKNALFGPMYARLADLIQEASDSMEARVILLTGSKDCFTSGNDVSTFGGISDEGVEDLPSTRFLHAIAHCEVPIVAAVNGPAIGVGTTMLMHCDLVIAGEEASFSTPFVDLGVAPEAASSFTMPQRLGPVRAAEMLMLGGKYNAAQALEWGLVNAVYPFDSFEAEALAVTQQLARKPPTSLRATKKLLRAAQLAPIDAATAAENREWQACLQSPEFAEAITAFMERRAPDFSRCGATQDPSAA